MYFEANIQIVTSPQKQNQIVTYITKKKTETCFK